MSSKGMVALLRTARPAVPILMLSSFCPVPCAYAAEVNVCVQKHESTIKLLTLINSLTAHRRAQSHRDVETAA